MIKAFNNVGIEGTYLSIIKAIYERPTSNIILSGENRPFVLRKRTDTSQGCPLSAVLFNIVREVLTLNNQTTTHIRGIEWRTQKRPLNSMVN